ncbi:MAG: helix-turn-helix domain-containing protein [Lactobacillus sp.]
MPKIFKYTENQINELKTTFEHHENARAIRRVQVVLLRAQGHSIKQVTAVTGASKAKISRLTCKYFAEGLEGLSKTSSSF